MRKRRAISVFPTPVGPIMRIFFGVTSLARSSGSCIRRQRFLNAIACTLASACPIMCRSSRATMSFGDRSVMIRGQLINGEIGIGIDAMPAALSASSTIVRAEISVLRSKASAAACAKGPQSQAIMPSSGSITSPLPVMISEVSVSATARMASSRLSIDLAANPLRARPRLG